MSRRFAENTSVSTDRSRAEIDGLLVRYGATSFMYGMNPTASMIAFEMKGRRIKFVIPMPDRNAPEFNTGVHPHSHKPTKLSPEKAAVKYEQATRQRWRALALCIKAKLESVEARIETFEEAFMPHVVMSDGRTIGEVLLPDIGKLVESSKLPPMIEAPAAGQKGAAR